ncbi:MAG TPA: CHAT domain-containing protein [Bryobacteraceae bacterium]|jgi:hypothetical protein
MGKPTTYSDLELILGQRGVSMGTESAMDVEVPQPITYFVGFRFDRAGDEGEQYTERTFTLNIAEAMNTWDADDYAPNLTRAFFNPDVKGEFNRYRALALDSSEDSGLKVRISIDSIASDLHKIHWETLRDPGVDDPAEDAPLFTGERTIVSRFLASSYDSKPICLRKRGDLSALVVIANPQDLDNYRLKPVIWQDQLSAAKDAMDGTGGARITVEHLASGGGVPLTDIIAKLQNGDGYDILYLVCHGMLSKGGPLLFLEDKGPTSGAGFVTAIRELVRRPAMIVLASCQSAGTAGVGTAGVGPKLADAGIPAVIAMQGNIKMDAARDFMKEFFRQLTGDGQIDRAVSLARGAVRERLDYWKPVLFMRLRHGRLWYDPGDPGFENSDEAPWRTILERIRNSSLPPPRPPLQPPPACIPVIGPDILEPIWGTTREIASWMAKRYQFPLEEHLSEDLPAVAQFIQTELDDAEFDQGLDAYLVDRLKQEVAGANVWERLSAVASMRRASVGEDAHRLLATLPCTIYFTACQDRLLEEALSEAGREPVSDFARWKPELQKKDLFPGPDESYRPSVGTPYVYHLFGDAAIEPESRVVTEDDYADYMLGINRQASMAFVPSFVRAALTSGALLFLGLHFKDRAFQIVLRNALNQIPNPKKKSMWVGAQIPPEPDRYLRVQAARIHIEKAIGSDLKIYWGSTQQFIREFSRNARNMFPAWFESNSRVTPASSEAAAGSGPAR